MNEASATSKDCGSNAGDKNELQQDATDAFLVCFSLLFWCHLIYPPAPAKRHYDTKTSATLAPFAPLILTHTELLSSQNRRYKSIVDRIWKDR